MVQRSRSSKPSIPSNVLFKEADAGGYLFDSFSGYVYRLNKTGVLVVKLCDGNNNIDKIVSKLARIYKLDKEAVLDDVGSFLAKLQDCHLLGEG